MSKLEVGDICITQNTRVPLLNNGLLVEIVAIDPTLNGGLDPYIIRRIDGHRIPSTIDSSGVLQSFFANAQTGTSAHKLRRVDPEDTSRCEEKTERLTEQA